MATMHEFVGRTDLDACGDRIMEALLGRGIEDPAVSVDLLARTIEVEVLIDYGDPVAEFGRARREILAALDSAGVCITEMEDEPVVGTEPDWAITPQRDLLPA